MDERENESNQEVVPVTGVAACPAIERVSAVMQIEPGLFTAGVSINFTYSCGVELAMHRCEFSQVEEMASLLGVSPIPVEVSLPRDEQEPDGGKLWVTFRNGTRPSDGGMQIIWFTTGSTAAKALERVQSAASNTRVSESALLRN